jgi:hypothetical protein
MQEGPTRRRRHLRLVNHYYLEPIKLAVQWRGETPEEIKTTN